VQNVHADMMSVMKDSGDTNTLAKIIIIVNQGHNNDINKNQYEIKYQSSSKKEMLNH